MPPRWLTRIAANIGIRGAGSGDLARIAVEITGPDIIELDKKARPPYGKGHKRADERRHQNGSFWRKFF